MSIRISPGCNIFPKQAVVHFKCIGKAIIKDFQGVVSTAEKVGYKLAHIASNIQKELTLTARSIKKATTSPTTQKLTKLTVSEIQYRYNIMELRDVIKEKCTETEGVFSLPGDEKRAQELANAMRTATPIDLFYEFKDATVHTLASALKKLLVKDRPFSHKNMEELASVIDRPDQFIAHLAAILKTKGLFPLLLLDSFKQCADTLDQHSAKIKMPLSNFAISVASMAEATANPVKAERYNAVLSGVLRVKMQEIYDRQRSQAETSNAK